MTHRCLTFSLFALEIDVFRSVCRVLVFNHPIDGRGHEFGGWRGIIHVTMCVLFTQGWLSLWVFERE